MSDIVERLRKWSISTDAVPASDLMDEAAKEIEWLRQNRNDTPSQQLLAAYQLGVSHRDPPDQVRNGAAEGRETVQLTDAEREALEWAVFEFDGVRPDNGKAAERAATLRGLLERLK